MFPKTCAGEAVHDWIDTRIEHGQYDSDLMSGAVYHLAW